MSRLTAVLGLGLLVLSGCVNPQTRMQMAEDAEIKRDLSIKTVGEIADLRSPGPVQVSGIGLVTGLDGTGGTPSGPYRQALEQILRKQKVEHVKEMLDSPTCALVVVSAFLQAGSRKGDRCDAEVTLPPGSKASSLAGGTLQFCTLRNHDSTKGLLPDYNGPDRAIAGHVLAVARGPVMLGLGEGATAGELKRGRVWRGCASQIELPFALVLRKDDKSVRVAQAVAERLNYLFQDDPARLQRLSQQARQLAVLDDMAKQVNRKFDVTSDGGKVARVENKETVQIRVPYAYRFNADRYLYIAHMVPLAEDAEHQTRYRRRLQKLLTDPAETVMAARRLEALGRESIPVLRSGLGHEHPLVRFACAESLAYLGESTGVDELARLAARYPLLGSSCLTALASLDERNCRQRLMELLAAEDPALRAQAFATLRTLGERDLPEPGMKTAWGEPFRETLHKQLNGELLNGSFWLHRVAPQSSRLVAFAADTRAEVVLFGEKVGLSAPVRTTAGQEFTLTFEPGGDRCTVSRFSPRLGKRQKLCSPALEDIVRTMAELGADYPAVVDLIRKLDEHDCLNCRVRLNATPPEVTPQMLAEAGRNGLLTGEETQPIAGPAGTH